MTNNISTNELAEMGKGFSGKQVLLIVLLTLLVTVVCTYIVLQRYVFLKEFTPVSLNMTETQLLNSKLQALGFQPETSSQTIPPKEIPASTNHDLNAEQAETDSEDKLEPEPYSEDPQKREINLSEKELNAILANNTDLAKRLAIDLSADLASAKMLIPMQEDFPILGGKTLRVNAGLGLSFTNDRPVVILKGVSIMGVPIPNAWLGNLKNVDLVNEFGLESGFWNTFAAGVEYVNVQDGMLQIKLKE